MSSLEKSVKDTVLHAVELISKKVIMLMNDLCDE